MNGREYLTMEAAQNRIRELDAQAEAAKKVIEAARKYLEYSFTSDRRGLRDALRDYDYLKAVEK
jgi:hypothetical protein